MTILEIILSIIVWIGIASFICIKRNWYRHLCSDVSPEQGFSIFFAYLLSPIILVIVFFREFIGGDWNNEKQ